MKKILLLFLLIILVSGCKNKKYDELVCKYNNSDKQEDKVTFYFDNDESVNYDKTTKLVFETYMDASNYYKNVNLDYDTVEVVDNEVTMNIKENLDGMTKEEVISMYEKYGFECK